VRIQQCAGGKDASHTVLAVRQLRSGDLVIHMDSPCRGKRDGKPEELGRGNLSKRRVTEKDLAGHFRRRKSARLQRDAWKRNTTHIEKEIAKLAPNLKIRGMRWLRRIDKEYAQILIFLRQSGSRIDGISKLY